MPPSPPSTPSGSGRGPAAGGLWSRRGALALVAATLLAYAPTLGSHFLADDFALFTGPLLAEGRNPLLSHAGFIRPLPRLSMRADFLLWGWNTVPAHLENLLLHLACSLMLGSLALRAGASRVAAWSAALLFALHPIHVGAVSWLSARFDLLCTAFLLGSLLKYDDHVAGRGRWALAVSLLLFGGALLSKELAVSFPLALALYELARPRAGGPYRWRALVPHAVLAGLYLALRVQLLGRIAPPARRAFGAGDYVERLLVVPARVMSAPVDDLQWGSWAPALTTAIAVLLAAVVVLGLWRTRLRLTPVAWLGVGLALVAALPMVRVLGGVREGLAASRLFYLPSAGFCVVLGALLGVARAGARRALLAPLAALFALTTFGNNLAWRKAGILSEAIPRQVVERYPTFGVKNPIVIVQDPPRRYNGAYLFLPTTLERALRLAHPERLQAEVVETIGRRSVSDLRRFDRPARVFALRWDPEREQLVDVTESVRAALRAVGEEPRTVREWTAGELGPWTAAEPAGVEVGERGVEARLGETALTLDSPPLSLATGALELEVTCTALEPPRGRRRRVVVSWWADGQTPGLNRAERRLEVDGEAQRYLVPTPLRCFEDLQGEHLRARVRLEAPGCRVALRSVRALPFEAP